MHPLLTLLLAATAEATLAVLILWRSARREAAHARHVDALMAQAMAEQAPRLEMRRQFDEIVAANWPRRRGGVR